jgi:hypothetical protein
LEHIVAIDPLDWFVNREKQYLGFQKMLAGDTAKSVMLIKAPADMGKSWLMQKMRVHCETKGIPVMSVSFADRRAYDYLSLIRLTRDQMGIHYFNAVTEAINNFTQTTVNIVGRGGGNAGVQVSGVAGSVGIEGDIAGRDIIKDNQFFIQANSDVSRRAAEIQINDTFFVCLKQLLTQKKAVFLLDGYDNITDEAAHWVRDYLLLRQGEGFIAGTIIIIAGREVPELNPTLRGIVAKTGLELFEEKHVTEYIQNKRGLQGLDLPTLYRTSGGYPGLLAKMADLAAMATEEEDDDWL